MQHRLTRTPGLLSLLLSCSGHAGRSHKPPQGQALAQGRGPSLAEPAPASFQGHAGPRAGCFSDLVQHNHLSGGTDGRSPLVSDGLLLQFCESVRSLEKTCLGGPTTSLRAHTESGECVRTASAPRGCGTEVLLRNKRVPKCSGGPPGGVLEAVLQAGRPWGGLPGPCPPEKPPELPQEPGEERARRPLLGTRGLPGAFGCSRRPGRQAGLLGSSSPTPPPASGPDSAPGPASHTSQHLSSPSCPQQRGPGGGLRPLHGFVSCNMYKES